MSMQHLEITVEDLFPHWLTARIILSQWINEIEGWWVGQNPSNPMQVCINLSHQTNLFALLPLEDVEAVSGIFYDVMHKYTEEVCEDFIGAPITQLTLVRLKAALTGREQEQTAKGEPGIKEAMKIAFGISTKFRHITMNLTHH